MTTLNISKITKISIVPTEDKGSIIKYIEVIHSFEHTLSIHISSNEKMLY